jgi:hypothetical protein
MIKSYPGDDPDTAAKKAHEEWKKDGWHSIPKSQKKGDGNGKDKDKDKKHPHYVQKYAESGSGLLAEAVIVRGIPFFAVSRAGSKDITLEKSIPIDDTSEYRPFELSAYLSEPYRFKSKQHFEASVEIVRRETRDSIFRKVKAIWSKYIDADDFHISLCAADTIFTYYQDKMGMTHYLFFIGGNNSGKSNNLLVLKYLAYRNFTSTDMTYANIYQFLGSGEEGQGTLCEDEADRIDEDKSKMAIHKNGYIKGIPVARTDTSFGRKQMKFNTYCFKAFAAERFPDPVKGKGFNQRVIELQCSSGNPQHDIAEVTDETGAEEFQVLREELSEVRNTLLLSRLLDFHKVIPDIKLNIRGREKQLFKPVVRIFQKTETLAELLPVISNYVMQKREANYSSFHSFLYKAIMDLIIERQTTKLQSGFIWEYIKSNLQGADIRGKPLSYDSSEFGELSQKEVTQTLEHIFGARAKKSHGVTALRFDMSKLKRLGNIYDLSPEVKVIEGEDGEHGEDVGIGRYIAASSNEHNEIALNAISEHEDTQDNGLMDPVHLPDPPHPPHMTPEMEAADRLRLYDELSKKSREASKAAVNTAKFKTQDNQLRQADEKETRKPRKMAGSDL